MNIKKKHHFISQIYLKHWTRKYKNKQKLYAYFDNKIHPKPTEDVAFEGYFYQMYGINRAEREFLLRGVSQVKTPYVDEYFKSIIDICSIIGAAESGGVPEDNAEARLIKANIIEDYYGITENIVVSAYESIISNKIDQIDINDYQNILRFAIYQNGKTPKVKEKIRTNISESLKERGIRFDRWYTLSILMTSEQIFMKFVESLYKITVIINNTNINYITNDNPVVNLRGIDEKYVEFFWPISPKKAIVISPYTESEVEMAEIKNIWLKKGEMKRYFIDTKDENDESTVRKMNIMSWKNKSRFAFSLDKRDLEDLMLTE